MAEEQEKTIRVVQFSGKDKAKFRSFDAKLKVIGSTKGWHDALIDENCVPQEDESADSKQKLLRKERIENDSEAMTQLEWFSLALQPSCRSLCTKILLTKMTQ